MDDRSQATQGVRFALKFLVQRGIQEGTSEYSLTPVGRQLAERFGVL
jgi:hypothetical protein